MYNDQYTMTLSIIIVSYNTKELTIQAIDSVLQSTLQDKEIIVVDNNSTDGSVEALKKKFGKKITLIERKDNGGFSKANNDGIKIATGEYILLLNSDTIVPQDALKKMTQFLDENPSYGVISSRLLNADGSYQPQGGALPNLLNIKAWWLWPLPGQIPFVDAYQNATNLSESSEAIVARGWVGGTAMMIRTEVIEKVGLLDEHIFMYAEDIELCFRVRQAHFEIGIHTRSEITHIGSASGSSKNAKLGEIRGLLYFFKIHKPSWQLPLLKLIIFSGALLRCILFGILRGSSDARSLYSSILEISMK